MSLSLQALKDPNSARLFSAQMISQACDKMMTVGLIWVLIQNYSPSLIPWFLGVAALPHLLLSWSSGRWTMSWGPLKTVFWTDVFRGVLFVLLWLLCLLFWKTISAEHDLEVLFAFVFVSNLAGALFNPAILSLPVFLPDQSLLQQTTALIDSCFSLGNIVGPLLSTALYPLVGLSGLFLFNGLSYLFAAVLESQIQVVKPGPPLAEVEAEAGTRISQSRSMRKLLSSDPLLSFMLGGFLAINIFLGPLMVFLPMFAKTQYQGTIGTLAVLETAIAFGTLLGGLALAVIRLDSKKGVKIATSMMAVALSYVAFSLSSTVWAGCLILFVLGFSLSMVNIFSLNLFQSRPRPEDVPTIMSLVNLISTASLPFSMIIVGYLVEKVHDTRSLALSFSGILAVITLGVASNRELRRQ
jgi:DHA3 family macrolide efflux protein-like MFS transporter